MAFGGDQETAVKVTEIIMAGAGVVAYIISEGLVDAAYQSKPEAVEVPPDEEYGEG